jgi:hypothetical protein
VPESRNRGRQTRFPLTGTPPGVLVNRRFVTGGDASQRFAQGSLCHRLMLPKNI